MDDEELSRSEEKQLERARADANNAQNIRNAADVAIASGEPHAVAVGGAIKAVDAVTGGAGSELVGNVLTRANELSPTGKMTQGALNKLNESGAGDLAGDVASMYNTAQGVGNKGGDSPNQVKKPGEGGEQGSSLPSSGDKNAPGAKPEEKTADGKTPEEKKAADAKKAEEEKKKEIDSKPSDDTKFDEDGKPKGHSFIGGIVSPIVKILLVAMAPSLLVVLFVVIIIASVVGYVSDYDDALGISAAQGEDTGGVIFNASSTAQQEFFNRVLDVRSNYLAQGKNVDALKVVAVYHVLKSRGANITYESMTTEAINDIADCMFLNNVYSDETFRNNLITYLIPKYLPDTTDAERESIADDVFEYVENYYDLIGKEITSSCSSVGSCNYNISGFWINGKGNVSKNLNINDLYVRMMQCGTSSGHNYGGTYGQPLEGEELVPFEKYILGVAYAEIGPGAPEQAFKAQMIASRSFILARPTDMGGWRTLQQESDGRWVIQVAACTADQVYCDPDQGCSTVVGGNGQWSQVYSGSGHGRTIKGPISADSPLRQYAADVQGEVLINNQGYVVSTPYLAAESNQFTSLANSGLNYKQIMVQVYSQKFASAGVSDIYKASCGNCVSNGEYASWKQYEGQWVNVQLGSSGRSIRQIGCLATSIAIQIARSGVATNVNGEFNPGTFVEAMSSQGAFGGSGALLSYASVQNVAPEFKYQSYVELSGMSRQDKLNTINSIVSQPGVYAVAEVKGNTGQHWVAIDSVNGDTINMMDPGSPATDMWAQYNWVNTSRIVYYKVG